MESQQSEGIMAKIFFFPPSSLRPKNLFGGQELCRSLRKDAPPWTELEPNGSSRSGSMSNGDGPMRRPLLLPDEDGLTPTRPSTSAAAQQEPKMPSHKTFRIKKKLAKKMRQNRPIPHWIRMRTDNTIRYNAKRRHWRRTKLGF
ncbi:hypothetical protein NL676_034158 [Syzygium grande]|nr:hypothetical protein NL676_034158 [Syzygium grande]